MKNIREYEFWDNDLFGFMNNDLTIGEAWGFSLLFNTVGAIFGMLALSAPLIASGFGDISLVIGAAAGIVISSIIPRLGKVYKGHSLTWDDDWVDGVGRRVRRVWNFRARAREYFSLPAADRALYPTDIIEAMRDPDLTIQQKHDLNDVLRTLYEDICERERQIRLANKRQVDVSGIIEHVNTSREHIKLETNTYKEWA